ASFRENRFRNGPSFPSRCAHTLRGGNSHRNCGISTALRNSSHDHNCASKDNNCRNSPNKTGTKTQTDNCRWTTNSCIRTGNRKATHTNNPHRLPGCPRKARNPDKQYSEAHSEPSPAPSSEVGFGIHA